jgi:hypothetical protein
MVYDRIASQRECTRMRREAVGRQEQRKPNQWHRHPALPRPVVATCLAQVSPDLTVPPDQRYPECRQRPSVHSMPPPRSGRPFSCVGTMAGMFAVQLRRGVYAQDAILTVKVATPDAAMRFIERFCKVGMVHSCGATTYVFAWEELWGMRATPIATINELPLPNS